MLWRFTRCPSQQRKPAGAMGADPLGGTTAYNIEEKQRGKRNKEEREIDETPFMSLYFQALPCHQNCLRGTLLNENETPVMIILKQKDQMN